MTLLLDIDGVLIGWEKSKPGEDSGFDDWVTSKHSHINWISAEQLNLIQSSFTDIQWHTTWIQKFYTLPGSHTDEFTETTGFGPFPILIEKLPLNKESGWRVAPDRRFVPFATIAEEVHPALHSAGWWKLNAVAALLSIDELPGRVVWADDDISAFLPQIQSVLEFFDAEERIALVSPLEVFTRSAIERTSAWVNDGS